MWPSDALLLAAWERLVADPDTAAEFAGLVLDPLAKAVAARPRFRTVDPDSISEAAAVAVLAVIKRPSGYDPTRSPLRSFLTLIAGRKLLSRLAADRKHVAGRIPWDSVALDRPARKDEVDDDAVSFDSPGLRPIIAAFSPAERAVFELMRDGERATTAYAAALGLSDRPRPEQEAEVKRAKDRIRARFLRSVEATRD